LHVTGQIESPHLDQDRAALHEAKDQLGMLSRVCKAAFRAARTEDIPAVMREAVQAALSGRPGPVSVEIPIDQQYRTVEASVAPCELPRPVMPDVEAIEAAASLLAQAERPLIWAGGGVIASGASQAVQSVAERIGAGVLTTAAGRGAIPEDHPQCIGYFSLEPSVGELLERSDLLLAIGTRFRGNETRSWQLPLPRPRVQIDIEPSLIGRNYEIDVAIVGDARLALEALPKRIGAHVDVAWLEQVREVRRQALARLRATLGPYERILDDLREALPRGAIVVRDVTVPATTWGARALETYEPRTAIHSATFAIGLGLATAIGASIARPDRHVVLVAGDGGFASGLAELVTASQERAAVKVILFNDGGYGILRNLQDAYFGGRHFGVDLQTPDHLAVGKACGAWVGQVRTAVEMRPLLVEALQFDGPAILEVDMAAVGPPAVPFTGSARLIPAG
jgi:acetolactate synthase-1/2/3 large subunit